MNPLRIAVVGAGHLGSIHARLLASLPDVHLVAVIDPSSTARHRVATQLAVPVVDRLEALTTPLDGAIVATPTHLHYDLASQLLAAGVHVLVEKPITTTVAQANQLIQLAAEHGRVLQVGHVERFNAAWNAVAPAVQDARYIEAVRAGTYTFRSTDVSIVLDLMIHDLDLVLSLVRAPVAQVEAFGLAVFGPHEDLAHARIHFEDGCVADFKASRVSYAPQRTMHIFAPRGFAAIDFAAGTAELVRPSDAVRRREVDLTECPPDQQAALREQRFADLLCQETVAITPVNAILEEHRDFVQAIRHQTPVRVPGEHGRDALAVAEQILEAVAHHSWHGAASGPVGPRARFEPTPARRPKAA